MSYIIKKFKANHNKYHVDQISYKRKTQYYKEKS